MTCELDKTLMQQCPILLLKSIITKSGSAIAKVKSSMQHTRLWGFSVFEGEKTPVFWLGLVVLGYSVFQFSNAIWQLVYYFLIYPYTYPQQFFPAGSTSYTEYLRLVALSQSVVPSIISGLIFLVIGLTIMRVGVKKGQRSSQQTEQPQATAEH